MTPNNWLIPVFPDRLPPRPSPRASWPSVFGGVHNRAIFPVADVLASVTFFPVMPERRALSRPVAERLAVTASGVLAPPAISPIALWPERPVRGIAARAMAQWAAGAIAPPLGPLILIGQYQAWRPTFPARGIHAGRFTPGEAFMAILPAVAASGIGCVAWGPEALTRTDLTSETVAAPDLLSEARTAPDLLREEVC